MTLISFVIIAGFILMLGPRLMFVVQEMSKGCVLYDDRCSGLPADWQINDATKQCNRYVFWSRKKFRHIVDEGEGDTNIDLFTQKFLECRMDKRGQPLTKRVLKAPEKLPDGWYRYEICDLDGIGMSNCQMGRSSGQWELAFHGSCVMAIHSILWHGCLKESSNRSFGDRFFEGIPGVYCFKAERENKALNYSVHVDIDGSRVFYAVKFVVLVDRARRLGAGKKTDQWIQPIDSVVLRYLCIRPRTARELEDGTVVMLKWVPQLEANYKHFYSACVGYKDEPQKEIGAEDELQKDVFQKDELQKETGAIQVQSNVCHYRNVELISCGIFNFEDQKLKETGGGQGSNPVKVYLAGKSAWESRKLNFDWGCHRRMFITSLLQNFPKYKGYDVHVVDCRVLKDPNPQTNHMGYHPLVLRGVINAGPVAGLFKQVRTFVADDKRTQKKTHSFCMQLWKTSKCGF